jgi:hypothetical protein
VEPASEPDSQGTDLATQLRAEYTAARTEQKRLRSFTRLASLCLVVVLVGSIWSIVALAADQWAPEKFGPPLEVEAQEITPVAERHARQLVERVVPEYERAARQKLEETLPELRESLALEWKLMGSNLASTTEPAVTEALERLQTRQWERMSSHFPILATVEGRQAFADAWSTQVMADQAELLKEIDLRFAPHVESLHERMKKFRPNRFDDWHQDDLSRYFVHLWLQLLDRKILGQIENPEVHDVE